MDDQANGAMSRRGFLKAAVGVLSAVVGVVLAVPLLGNVIGGIYGRRKGAFVPVAPIDAVPIGQPVTLQFAYVTADAYLRQTDQYSVWVIKHSANDVTVFSPVCTHLGCRFDWDAGAKRFICPCHRSIFAITGEVLGGPAPRPLDTLPYKIEGGRLMVAWERFEPGIKEKVRI